MLPSILSYCPKHWEATPQITGINGSPERSDVIVSVSSDCSGTESVTIVAVVAVLLMADSTGLRTDRESVRAGALQPVASPPILPPLVFGKNSVDILGTLLKTLLSRPTRSSFALRFAAPDSYLRFAIHICYLHVRLGNS